MRKDVVLYSGGADSTYLLYKLALECEGRKFKQKPIIAYSLNVSHIDCRDLDKQYRIKQRAWFKKHGLDKYIKFIEDKVNIHQPPLAHIPRSNPSQPIIWLGNIISQFALFDCIIHMGYIRTDDFWKYDFNLFNEVLNMLKKYDDEIKIDFQYDLEYLTKAQIYARLDELKIPVSHCVTPQKGKECGQCSKCLEYKAAQLFNEYVDQQKEKVKNEVKEMYKPTRINRVTRKRTGSRKKTVVLQQ